VPAAMLGGAEAEGDPREAIGCLHDLEAMAADDPDLSRWAAISLPTLIMQGGETWSPMPATMDALAKAMPAATRVTLPGQSHFATHTAPELFAAELAKFLTKW
jgi:pimeloyl-ACP methyl ester carboxylesterase